MADKNRRLSIKLTQEDFEKIHRKAEKSNKNLTDYVTSVCLGREIVVINGLAEVIKQQKAIGRNINQITMLANMGKVTVINLSETVQQLSYTNALLKNILERRSWK